MTETFSRAKLPATQHLSVMFMAYLTYVLSLLVHQKRQTTFLRSFAPAFILLQMYLKPFVYKSLSRPLFQVLCDRPIPRWPFGVQCNACFAMMSSLFVSVCPSQIHLLLVQLMGFTAWAPGGVLSTSVLSGQSMLTILHKHLLTRTCSLSTVLYTL